MNEIKIRKICLGVLTIIVGIVSLFSGYPTDKLQVINEVKTSSNVSATKVTDASTANNYMTVLGNRSDGGRYAGRVWTDKSVYQEGMRNVDGISTNINLDSSKGEEFLISFSALGSSRILKGESTTPVDLVLVLDVSTSMDADTMDILVTETNQLINQLMDINSSNRVGVVVYGGGTEILLPLDHYTRNGSSTLITNRREFGNKYYNSLRTNVKNSKGQIIQNQSSYFWADSTYLQGALYQGMEMLAAESTTTYFDATKGEYASRIPAMIVMSDGGTNIVSATSTGNTSSGSYDWWNPYVGVIARHNGTQYYASPNGNPFYASISSNTLNYEEAIAGRTLAVLMTAGYMKKAIENNYKTSMMGYSIGLNMDGLSNQEKEQLYGTLDPTNNFKSDSKYEELKKSYSTWQSYLKGNTPSISWTLDGKWVGATLSATWNYKHLPANAKYYTSDFTSETDLNYIERFYEATDDTIGEIFDRIVNRLDNVAFHPVSDVSGTSSTLDLTYTDPIGEYMEVKDVKGLTLFGKFYQVQDREVSADGKTTIYKFESTNLNHPSYVNPVIIDLSKILVQVTEDNNGFQTMTIGVSEGAIPLRLETVTLKDGNIESYTSNSETNQSLPLRIFYSVGLKDSIKIDTDGDSKVDTVDLSKISSEYKAKNRNSDGTINFYSNLYTGNKSSAVSSTNTVGNATVTFEPSMQNRYYYFQKNRIIYASNTPKPNGFEDVTPDGTNNPGNDYTPVTNISDLDDNENYYFVIDYYRPVGNNGRGEYVNYIVQRTGAELKGSVTYYDPTTKTTSSTPGVGYVVATAVEGTRLGRLNRFTNEKNPGVTETANYSYAPTNEVTADGQKIRVYLGNNGKLRVTGSNLTITKKLLGNGISADTNKDWNFTIKVKNGVTPISGEISTGTGTVQFSDEGIATLTLKGGESITLYNLPAGADYEVTEVEANENDYVTATKNATGTIKENDTVEVEFTNTKNVGSLTLKKTVEGNGGDTNKTFTFIINLYEKDGITPVTKTYSCGTNCTIKSGDEITLKHGESITIEGIKTGLNYSVIEKEANQDGYITTKSNDSGTITDNNTEVSFINKREVGGLTISKIVAGNGGNVDTEWHFKINIGSNREYDYKDIDGKKLGTVKDGSVITLKHNEKVIIEGIEVGTTYSVEELEANQDGYVTTSTNASGQITDNGVTTTYTNTKELRDLEISKVVKNSPENENKEWHFTIKLTKNNVPLTGEFDCGNGNKIIITESGGDFTLKHNETFIITGLPIGTTYEIVELEANQDGMITTVSKPLGKGTIEDDNNKNKVEFVNSKETGTLMLSKKVTGKDGDLTATWSFVLNFKDVDGNVLLDTYNYTGDKTGTVKSGDTITLVNGEFIIIHGLADISYEIIEKEANQDGYVTTVENNNAVGKVPSDDNAFVTFVNHKEIPVGSITISKIVTGIGNKDNYWNFKVKFTDENGLELSERYTYDKGTIASGETFSIKHGESITISGIKEGINYEVIEEKANTEGYETTSNNEKGKIKGNSVIAVDFVNHKEAPKLNNLIISKTVVGTNIDVDKEFTFIVTFPNSIKSYYYEGSSGKTGTIKSGDEITLKHEESITIYDLEEGTEYVVSEKLESGYNVLIENNNAHDTIQKEDVEVHFINTKKEGELTLSKIVKGSNGDTERYWSFLITLRDKEGNEIENAYQFIGENFGGILKSGDIVRLKSGENITILGLEAGISYEIVEKEANQDDYKTVSSNAKGFIVEDKTIEVTYVNTKVDVPEIPNTFDNGNPFMWLIVALISFVGIITCFVVRRRIDM